MLKLLRPVGGALILLAGFAVSAANAQTPEQIPIKFKLFDTNNPKSTKPVEPRPVALLSSRDQTTKLPAFPKEVNVTPVADGFYQVMVDKDILIEHLVIEVVGTRYSPADVAKVVTKAPITLYPGVSASDDEFSFSAYSAQLNTYRAILTDLITALPDQKDQIRTLLGNAFRVQLENMAKVPTTPGRLLNARQEDIQAAEKLANEVLVLYGLRAEPSATPPACPAPPTYYYPCPPRPRCCFFSCWR